MLGISSEARFAENVRANFVACSAAWLELYNFISFSDVTIFFLICYCEFLSGKGSSKINKSKDSSLVSLMKSFCGNTRLSREFKHQS